MNPENQRIADLLESYESVGSLIQQRTDLKKEDLASSRSFFLDESLAKKNPVPAEVDVFAILSGISFYEESQLYIKSIIHDLEKLLDDETFYFVQPKNLGVEYAVIKWPEDSFSEDLIERTLNFLDRWDGNSFHLRIEGIQIHLDGCIVLRGIDLGSEIFKFRKKLFSEINGLPLKQSNWAHVPLGRILAPVGQDKMTQIKKTTQELNKKMKHEILIDKIHLVNEKRWYMEEKNYLLTKTLK